MDVSSNQMETRLYASSYISRKRMRMSPNRHVPSGRAPRETLAEVTLDIPEKKLVRDCMFNVPWNGLAIHVEQCERERVKRNDRLWGLELAKFKSGKCVGIDVHLGGET
jgi:hypothetical protein